MDAAPAPSSGDDPRDFLVDQEFADYTDTDHATWRTLARRQRALLQGRILPTFLYGLEALGIGETGIPEFRVMNQRLRAATGWEVVAVPGLVPDLVFFKLLADRRFPAGFWIRKPEQIEYIEEPDVFHDVFGHVPLLMQPLYADYLAAYGRAGLRRRARGPAPPRPAVLVHGRVRPRPDAGGFTYRRRRHRLLALRDGVRAGEPLA